MSILLQIICCVVLFHLLAAIEQSTGPATEDIFVPEHCDNIAQSTDHLLIDYEVFFQNGTVAASNAPGQLFHIQLDSGDDLPVARGLKGMCQNASRSLSWANAKDANLNPLLIAAKLADVNDESIRLKMNLRKITTQSDYQIFDSIKNNFSRVLDMIEEQQGVNAMDEWGQTPLMIAVINQYMPIVSALLNARKPKVDINAAKASGYTVIHYAVQKSNYAILQALLRRGGDPNAPITQMGSMGNTPLHFACLLEKQKHAEMLLEYGANPFAVNEYGQTPLQMLPAETVRSTKLYFKKLFEDAVGKYSNSLGGPGVKSDL